MSLEPKSAMQEVNTVPPWKSRFNLTVMHLPRNVVLTRESGEGKLEEVDILYEGKRPCKRHTDRLRKSSNWKRCSW